MRSTFASLPGCPVYTPASFTFLGFSPRQWKEELVFLPLPHPEEECFANEWSHLPLQQWHQFPSHDELDLPKKDCQIFYTDSTLVPSIGPITVRFPCDNLSSLLCAPLPMSYPESFSLDHSSPALPAHPQGLLLLSSCLSLRPEMKNFQQRARGCHPLHCKPVSFAMTYSALDIGKQLWTRQAFLTKLYAWALQSKIQITLEGHKHGLSFFLLLLHQEMSSEPRATYANAAELHLQYPQLFPHLNNLLTFTCVCLYVCMRMYLHELMCM